MSHIIKEYSKNLEVKPSNPVVNKHYYPIIPQNYIVIYNEQSIDSKRYNYYSLVIDLIKTKLEELGIKIVLIGSGKDMTNRADFVYPNLNFKKNAYIVSKSKLVISVDNAYTQYASSENIPVITLYGNVYPSVTTPYWSNKNNKVDLSPDWDKKPSLSLIDEKDSINKISAEKVAESVFKLLNPKSKFKLNFKTKLTNKNKDFSVDVIPTSYVELPFLNDSVIDLRLDRGKVNEEAFYSYLDNHKCNIVIKNNVLQPDVISNFTHNIDCIKLFLSEDIGDIPKEYFSFFKKRNIDFKIYVTNKQILDDIRFKYFEQRVEYFDPPKEKPDCVSFTDKFFSFKLVVDGGDVYKSTYHWKNNIDKEDKVVDNSNYWEELDYFYIYEQDRDS